MVLVSDGYCRVGEVAGRAMTWPRGGTAYMGLLGRSDGRKLCEDVILAQFKPLFLFSSGLTLRFQKQKHVKDC